MVTSALQRTETERWGGESLSLPQRLYGLDSRRARAHLKACLTARLTGVPECPLDVAEYPSDGLSYNPSDNGTPEMVGLPRHMALA